MRIGRIHHFLLAFPLALLVAGTALAQSTQRGGPGGGAKSTAPANAKAGANRESGATQPSTASSRAEARPGTSAQLSPEDRRKQAKIEIVSLTTRPKSSLIDEISAPLNLALPDGVTLKQIDVAIDVRFSNGDVKSMKFQQPSGQRAVQADIQRPPVKPPVFDCNACLNLASADKGTQEILARQCSLNNCPTPAPAPAGDKEKSKSLGGVPRTARSSTSGGSVPLAEISSVRLVVTARLTDKAIRGEFTVSDQREAKIVAKTANKSR
ncbi:MAG: hypothetical protein SF339_19085 [Blastocatellia bacterium]|nr:hypothetical protein [Blastocatellia bacterium]